MLRAMGCLTFAALIAVLVLIAGVIYRPAGIIGVHGDALAHSVRNELGAADSGTCTDRHDDAWLCRVPDGHGKGASTYRVTTHGLGCWDGELIAPRKAEGVPASPSACLNILDVVGAL